MGEAIIVFIFISWLLVTLIIYWVKHNVTVKDKSLENEIMKILDDVEN